MIALVKKDFDEYFDFIVCMESGTSLDPASSAESVKSL